MQHATWGLCVVGDSEGVLLLIITPIFNKGASQREGERIWRLVRRKLPGSVNLCGCATYITFMTWPFGIKNVFIFTTTEDSVPWHILNVILTLKWGQGYGGGGGSGCYSSTPFMIFSVTYYSEVHIAINILLLMHFFYQVKMLPVYSVQPTNLTFIVKQILAQHNSEKVSDNKIP